MNKSDRGYRDLQIGPISGQPELYVYAHQMCFVSDWSGRIRRIDLNNWNVVTSPPVLNGPVGGQLASLTGNTYRRQVAAATNAAWAVIWDQDTGNIEQLHSDNGRPVSAVVYSPDGRFLVLGTGGYSLGGTEPSEASLEIWYHDREWIFVRSVALPGASVDWLGWYEDADAIVAITGRTSQDGGNVCFIHGSEFVALRICELGSFFPHVCGWDEEFGRVFTCGKRLKHFPLEGAVVTYPAVDSGWELAGSCLCPQGILTTAGQLFWPRTGELLDSLPPLDDCCRVTSHLDSNYIGISPSGTLRVWAKCNIRRRRRPPLTWRILALFEAECW